ncbi:diguanylate cyclase domain-containing protein [Deinococcus malanensis]|uniref:diguanylate cyclase domain-containing protein n=1 Tax=Deinococcus malanensis TaxID=1706855 RepID=UPI00363028AD
MSLTDITESYTLRQQLEVQAQQDELTGLPNRRVFRRVLEQLATTEKWTPVHAAVLLVDVDQFKLVNDSYGQQVGDALLRSFAERLSDLVRGRGIVTRLAGDEFGLILDLNAMDRVDVSTVAQEVLDVLNGQLSVHGIELQVTASVGVCATGQGAPRFRICPGMRASRWVKPSARGPGCGRPSPPASLRRRTGASR